MTAVSRRSVLSAAAAAAGVLLTDGCSSESSPDGGDPVGPHSSSAPPAKPLAAASELSRVPTETVDPATGNPAFLVKGADSVEGAARDGGIVMLSAICTHMGCTVEWDAGKVEFVCPCHRATYDSSGNVVSGPAPQPLDRLPITVRRGEVYRA
jgi:cytochrome b6-f complex iron-sulfur subunit